MENTISVIIPAYNEQENIANVIKQVKLSKLVDEIIVVDNMSTDKTNEIAQKENVTVIKSYTRGKGYAMERGTKVAKNEILVFLDADVKNYKKDIIKTLVQPIIDGKAEFVKSCFDRTEGGTVTEITVKPLLNFLYPNQYNYKEPLSGMIAIKKSILEGVTIEKDYGVDIGLLIDMTNKGIKIEEVNIGKIENLSHQGKTIERMREMSLQIMRVIMKKRGLI